MRLDRLNSIEQYILGREHVSLEELCAQFNVSMNTIRRDIVELLKRGNIHKVYGGVTSSVINRPIGYAVRAQKNSAAKEIIGSLAAKFVEDGSSIFLDSGSTTATILHHMDDLNGVTVITHSLQVMYEASMHHNLNVIALGGIYTPTTSSYTGISTMDALSRLSIQTVFISSTGINLESGLTNSTYMEAEIKRSVCSRGKRVILMADQSKFGRTSVINFCSFEQLYAIVTDKQPQPQFMEIFNKNGVKVIYPGHENY